MTKAIQVSRWLLLAGFLFLYSCKKNTEEVKVVDVSKMELTTKVSAWLEQQKSPTYQSRNAKLQRLAAALDMANLRVEKQSEKEQYVVIPINSGLQLMDNKDKHPLTNLVLSLSQDGAITKGNIIQYVPKEGVATSLPQNTFSKLFSHQKLGCDGRFTILTLVGLYQYDLSFEAGQLRQLRKASKKGNGATVVRTGEIVCTHWYLVTYNYWSDGTITMDIDEDLGVTCSNCSAIGPNGEGTLCDEIEGSGGGGDIDYEYDLSRQQNWTPYISADQLNIVGSTESLNGVRKVSGASKFTSIEHRDDGVTNVMAYGNSSYATWHKDLWKYKLSADKKTGMTTISGKLTYPNNSFVDVSNKAYTWTADTDL